MVHNNKRLNQGLDRNMSPLLSKLNSYLQLEVDCSVCNWQWEMPVLGIVLEFLPSRV